MSILAIDGVMLQEPRLLVPQKQPLKRVRIDQTHPIGSKVIWCAIPSSRVELVSNRIIAGVLPPLTVYQDSLCWAFSGAQYLQDTFSPIESQFIPYTLFAIASCTNTSPVNTVFGLGNTTGGTLLDFAGSSANDPLRAGTDLALCKRNSPTYNALIPVWADMLAETVARVYQHKKTLTGTNDDTGTARPVTEVSIGSLVFDGSRTNYFNGFISFACILRPSTPEMSASLADDPYQFLVPA